MKKFQAEYDCIKIEKEDKVALYYTLQKQVSVVKEKILEFIVTPVYLIPFLQVGRMVKVREFEEKVAEKLANTFTITMLSLLSLSLGRR